MSVVPSCFSAHNASNSVNVAGAAITLPITDTHVINNGIFSLANDEVTILEGGDYEVSYSCSLLASSSSRSQAQAWLEVNSAEVGGTRTAMYCRLTNMGATGSSHVILSLALNDVVRVRALRTLGASVLTCVPNGVRLTLRGF